MSCASRAAAGLSAPSFSTGAVELAAFATVRIPTAFSLNLATAGAIVMYDRLRCLGRFATRPIAEGGRLEPRTENVQWGQCRRRRRL